MKTSIKYISHNNVSYKSEWAQVHETVCSYITNYMHESFLRSW